MTTASLITGPDNHPTLKHPGPTDAFITQVTLGIAMQPVHIFHTAIARNVRTLA